MTLLDPLLDPDNRLFALARAAQRETSVPVAIGLSFALIALMIATQVAARVILRPLFAGKGESIADPVAEMIGFLSIYLGLWALLRFYEKRPLSSLGFERANATPRVIRGTVVGVAMLAATTGLIVTSGTSFAPGALESTGAVALAMGLFFLLVSVVQASAEEALFRGWLLQVIGSRQAPWVGVLISSILFSLVHALGTGLALLPSLNLFLFGLFLALYALAERGLWGASAWHVCWNWTQGRLLGFPVSGSAGEGGLLTTLRPTGSDLISGGSFGPEGGLSATAVFVLAIAIVVLLDRRRGSRR